MLSIWDQKTAPSLERDGILLEWSGARIRLARAGGTNQKFNAAMEKLKRDHGKAIEGGWLNNDKGNALLHAVFAEHVVLGWETLTGVDEKTKEDIYENGIDMGGGELAPATKENIMLVFREIPTLFAECMATSQNPSFYLQSILEGAVKN
jgi:hypothetical protein